MTDALVDTLTGYLNKVDISPGSSIEDDIDNRNNHHDHDRVTALTLPEPLKSNEGSERNIRLMEMERETTINTSTLNTAAVINHKLNAGMVYRDYISDSSDLNSDTSSVDDPQYQRQLFRQSTGELTLISKAVSVDTHNSSDVSSSVVPAERNPVSDLLRSPASSAGSDDEDTAMSEYYSAESLKKKLAHHRNDKLSSDSINRQQPQQSRTMSVTNNDPPPPPPPPSLKKILQHYDHAIIPDAEEKKDQEDSAIPDIESNVKARFITMEEQLEANDELYLSSTEDQEIKKYGKLPNNLSMFNLALPADEEITHRKTEVRSLEQRRSIKRLNAIKELMETEETYSRDLGILCTVSSVYSEVSNILWF